MNKQLTARQQQLYDYAALYIAQHGKKPMYKQMRQEMGICNQSIFEILHYIEAKGWKMTDYGWIRIPDHLLEAHRERELYG